MEAVQRSQVLRPGRAQRLHLSSRWAQLLSIFFRSNKGIADLAGRVAVVTGAASGIGRALAELLAAQGCHLALVDLDAAGLAAVQATLSTDHARCRVTSHVADVGDRARMRALAPEVFAAHGAIHLLINNAGVAYEAAFAQTSLEDWDHVLGVNLWGVIHGCHVFLPYLAKADKAHIVNISSLFGIIAMPGQAAYCASKFAVRGLSESLWEELRTTTVGLTVVHPGGVATNIMKVARGDDPELLGRLSAWFEKNAAPPDRVAKQIVRAVQRGTPRLLINPETTGADLLKRLLPVRGNKWFGDAVIAMLGVEDMRAKRSLQWQVSMVDGGQAVLPTPAVGAERAPDDHRHGDSERHGQQ